MNAADAIRTSTDVSTWATRAIVKHTAEVDSRDGNGIMLTGIDEGRHLGGVDLEGCLDDRIQPGCYLGRTAEHPPAAVMRRAVGAYVAKFPPSDGERDERQQDIEHTAG